MRTNPIAPSASSRSLAAACTSAGSSVAPSVASPSAVAAVRPRRPSPRRRRPTRAPPAQPHARHAAGTLTIGTDNPAYPPYFAENAGRHDDRRRGSSATRPTARASRAPSATPSPSSSASPRTDVDLGRRARSTTRSPRARRRSTSTSTRSRSAGAGPAADLSDGYYFGNQSLVALKDSPSRRRRPIADLKDFMFGAQVGTTSLDAITESSRRRTSRWSTTRTTPRSRRSRPRPDRRHRRRPADRVLHDHVQVENATIVGQFEGGTPEHFSVVLEQGQPADRLRRTTRSRR